MKHFIIFSLGLIFSTGLLSLFLALIIYIKSKDQLLKHFLHFFLSFSLVLFSATIYLYITTNNISLKREYILILLLFNIGSISYFMFALPYFIHYLNNVKRITIKNTIVLLIAIAAGVVGIVSIFFIELKFPIDSKNNIGFMILNITLILISVYSLIPQPPKDDSFDIEQKRFGKHIWIISLIFFPGIFIDIMLQGKLPIMFFPFLYFAYALTMSIYIVKYYLSQINFATQFSEASTDEDFFVKYSISPRERDVFLLIIKGYNNIKIGDTLFISIPTVKTHVQRIFRKTKVHNRYELIKYINAKNYFYEKAS